MSPNYRTTMAFLASLLLLCSCSHTSDHALVSIFERHGGELDELHLLLSSAPSIRYVDHASVLVNGHSGLVSRKNALRDMSVLTHAQWKKYQEIEKSVGFTAVVTNEIGTMYVQFDGPEGVQHFV